MVRNGIEATKSAPTKRNKNRRQKEKNIVIDNSKAVERVKYTSTCSKKFHSSYTKSFVHCTKSERRIVNRKSRNVLSLVLASVRHEKKPVVADRKKNERTIRVLGTGTISLSHIVTFMHA